MDSILKDEIVTLDNNKEYICYSRIEDNNKVYLCLISNFKPIEIVFAKEIKEDDGITLELIYEQKEKEHVLELFKDTVLKMVR